LLKEVLFFKVGTQILKEMNKQKLPGEVTFMPLNRLHVRVIDYPQTKDAIAMVSKLEYEDKYDKVQSFLNPVPSLCLVLANLHFKRQNVLGKLLLFKLYLLKVVSSFSKSLNNKLVKRRYQTIFFLIKTSCVTQALRYIFGRTLICRNLEVATQLARTTGLDCVTLDGDQVKNKNIYCLKNIPRNSYTATRSIYLI
jgi:chromosome segregation ATPase